MQNTVQLWSVVRALRAGGHGRTNGVQFQVAQRTTRPRRQQRRSSQQTDDVGGTHWQSSGDRRRRSLDVSDSISASRCRQLTTLGTLLLRGEGVSWFTRLTHYNVLISPEREALLQRLHENIVCLLLEEGLWDSNLCHYWTCDKCQTRRWTWNVRGFQLTYRCVEVSSCTLYFYVIKGLEMFCRLRRKTSSKLGDRPTAFYSKIAR